MPPTSGRPLVLVVSVALAVALSACGGSTGVTGSFFLPNDTLTGAQPERNLPPVALPSRIVARYAAYLHGVLGMAYRTEAYHDPSGLEAASVSLSSITGHGAAVSVLKRFSRVSVLGTMSGAYRDDGSNVFDVKFIGILTAHNLRAGSVCASFTANNDPKYADQVVFGHFKILGGTGPAARLRADGTFLSIQPGIRTAANGSPRLTIRLGFRHLSIASSRGFPKACRDSIKPPLLPKATLNGFAFGPPTGPPGNATLYAGGSTVNGSVGCGTNNNNLFAVFTYSGPSGAGVQVNFVNNSSKGGNTSPLKQGKNNVLMLAGPPNGGYEILGSAYLSGRPNFLSFNDRLTLSRSC